MFPTEYKPYIMFVDQSESFTLGFEAGMLYQDMQRESFIEKTIHEKNIKQIELMSSKMGFTLSYTEIKDFDEWVLILLEKKNIKRIK